MRLLRNAGLALRIMLCLLGLAFYLSAQGTFGRTERPGEVTQKAVPTDVIGERERRVASSDSSSRGSIAA